MLKELNIKNVAVIDEVNIEFGKGFNALTGETGAGKSILIDSINMALGSRASHELIRTGCSKAFVNACFEIESEAIKEKLSKLGFEMEDDMLTVSRTLTSDGKSTCRINGIITPLALVREISSLLIDIHGQNDNRSLLNSKNHLALLDGFAEAANELESYKAEFKNVQKIKREIEQLSINEAEKERRTDILSFQINEISAANLKIGEDDELEARRDYLTNIESIVSGAGNAHSALYGSEENSAYDLLRSALRSISDISEYDKRLSDCAERLSGVIAETEDIASELSSCTENADFSMAELDSLEQRIDLINSLKRKYGGTIENITEYLKNAQNELSSITGSNERLKELSKELNIAMEKLESLAGVLSNKRKSFAKELEEKITAELTALDMPKVRFAVSISENAENGEVHYGENGKDCVEFLISTNPGEALKPMSKIASGGELSRIMLAVKSILSDGEFADTMIFDEIDTGVSGRAAQKIAEKICRLAAKKQILSITHLAQIASMANNHYLIQKTSTENETKTTVTLLSGENRAKELARIIGGVEVTDITLQSAREMLDMAKKHRDEL